jgi:hypothetical protein
VAGKLVTGDSDRLGLRSDLVRCYVSDHYTKSPLNNGKEHSISKPLNNNYIKKFLSKLLLGGQGLLNRAWIRDPKQAHSYKQQGTAHNRNKQPTTGTARFI